MKRRKILIIAERGSELAAALCPWLRKKGYQFQAVDNLEDIVISLIPMNRISVLLLDATVSDGFLCVDIAIVKRLFGNVPIVVVTEKNDPEKEKRIRKEGIFYYHVKAFGMNDLKAAISCAIQFAIQSDLPRE